ncbi:IS6 family transposase [Ruegeria atlantica]|uniref:IS6 family transposase n=1 Tax=Ruegeria atlantica TaxID=81569 RepID=UPI00249443DD|nr:IS6 family transposase [Ruegeria atlantica]
MTRPASFKYFKTSPEIIRLAVVLYTRFPLSLRNAEDLLHERGIDVSHETVRCWWNRFGPVFAAEIRGKRVHQLRAFSKWKWHVDRVFVKVNGKRHNLWRADGHEGEVLEAVVTKRRNKVAALKFLRKLMNRYGRVEEVVTDRLASYKAAPREMGALEKHQTGRWLNNRAENSHLSFRRRERAMQRFRRMRSLQKFASVHSSVYNHFNQERLLTRRDTFKLTRTAALTEWRQLCSG